MSVELRRALLVALLLLLAAVGAAAAPDVLCGEAAAVCEATP